MSSRSRTNHRTHRCDGVVRRGVGTMWEQTASTWRIVVESPAHSRPAAASAELFILFNGYVGERVASSVGFIRDGAARIIVDPGMVPAPARILDPLAALGETPEAITDV